MDGLLQGKRVLITGAGRNIGRGIALEMAAQGATIYFVEINAERVRQLSQDIAVAGGAAHGWVLDMSDPVAIDEFLVQLHGAVDGIDILVNNVGREAVHVRRDIDRARGFTPDPNAPPDTFQGVNIWRQVLETNLIGPLHLTQCIAQGMIEAGGGGAIIFITSVHQWIYRGDMIYSASKAATGMAIKELAMDLARHGIRVNGIAPGFVRTNPDGSVRPNRFAPLHRTTISPVDIGRAAVFLASDYFSRSITGTVLTVDAGLTLLSHFSELPPLG